MRCAESGRHRESFEQRRSAGPDDVRECLAAERAERLGIEKAVLGKVRARDIRILHGHLDGLLEGPLGFRYLFRRRALEQAPKAMT